MAEAYVIGHITVKNAEKWSEYRRSVPATIEPWKGVLVFRGKMTSVLSGSHKHNDTVIIKFPDKKTKDLSLGIVDAAKRTGSKIIIDDKLPKELNDMAATLAKVKATKPDVLVVSGHSKGALTAIRQIAEMKVDVPMLAMTHCDASKLAKQHGKNSEYALCAAQWHKELSYKDDYFGNGLKFDKDFNALYGYAPPYQAAESAAALLVYKDAFERANSTDKEKVRDALAKTDMETFYGNVKFGDGCQNTAKPMVLFQVRCEGDTCANKLVAPTKWASHKLVHPVPKWSER